MQMYKGPLIAHHKNGHHSDGKGCEKTGGDYLLSGHRQDGDKWECPTCSRIWVHVCDEANGCWWQLLVTSTYGKE